MFIKKLSWLLILLILNGCGFTPMYSSNFKNDFNIEIIDFEGDNDLNNFIKQKIGSTINNDEKNIKEFQISGTTTYSKNVQTKDKKGKVTQYSLNASANFTIKTQNVIEEISFTEKSTLNKLSDEFEESNYERSFKDNVSQIFVNKLIMYLSRIK